jgi:iron(III) transport system ATP-binding protein
MVQVADGTQLRVVTSAAESMQQGASVWLHLPPDRCRALTG